MLSWGFELCQTTAVSLVLFQRNLTDLLEEVLLTLGHKQHLVLPQIAQWACRLAATDSSLVIASAVKEGFQSQVIRR